MSDVIIKFESEGLEGVVAAGSYLSDAAKRLGVKIDGDCLDTGTPHECGMKVSAGQTLLSSPTQTEMEQLTSVARKNGERLACQTIIEKPGELIIMAVNKKKEETKTEDKSEEFKKEFEEMPLDKKIANLVELEAIALGETFSYVLNSPYKAVGKVVDVMAGFGFNMEKADRDAKRPEEHKKDESTGKSAAKGGTSKTATRNAAPKKTTAKRKASTRSRTKKPAEKGTTEEKTDNKDGE